MTATARRARGGASASPLRAVKTATACAIYTRVSQDASGRQRSPQEQEQGGRRDAEMYDLQVQAVYSDVIGASKRTTTTLRPDYERMKQDMARGLIDVLVIYGVDRGSRRTREWEDLIDLCQAHDVALMINGRMFTMSDPRDVAQVKREAVDAELEVEVLRMRVMRALAANVEAGMPHGKNLWGYTRVRDRSGRMVGVELSPESRLVREAFERYDGGESLMNIARDFERRGIPAPSGACPPDCDKTETKTGRVHKHRDGKWGDQAGASKLRQTLSNPSYLGHRTQGGEIVKRNVWPAIVDDDLFQRVQHRLRVAAKERRVINPNGSRVAHLLSGLMECGICGSPVAFTNVGSVGHRGGVYGVYRCKKGGHVARKAEICEEAIAGAMIDAASDPKMLAEWQRDNGKRLTAVTRELVELSTHLAESKALWKEGKIRPATYAEIEADYAPRIDALQAEQDRLNAGVPAEIKQIADSDVAKVIKRWQSATLLEKRAAIRSTLEIRVVAKQSSRSKEPGLLVRRRNANNDGKWVTL